jgi:hypothetical protein
LFLPNDISPPEVVINVCCEAVPEAIADAVAPFATELISTVW